MLFLQNKKTAKGNEPLTVG